MSGTLFTPPRFAPVNRSGVPYAGARLTFYQAGSATLATVYQTAALFSGAAHPNPVVANANGQFPAIYLNPTAGYSYKATLTDSNGTLLWSEDNIPAGPTSAQVGAALYPRTTAEISAGVTPVNYSQPPGTVTRTV